jgi:hypothetical protein
MGNQKPWIKGFQLGETDSQRAIEAPYLNKAVYLDALGYCWDVHHA